MVVVLAVAFLGFIFFCLPLPVLLALNPLLVPVAATYVPLPTAVVGSLPVLLLPPLPPLVCNSFFFSAMSFVSVSSDRSGSSV